MSFDFNLSSDDDDNDNDIVLDDRIDEGTATLINGGVLDGMNGDNARKLSASDILGSPGLTKSATDATGSINQACGDLESDDDSPGDDSNGDADNHGGFNFNGYDDYYDFDEYGDKESGATTTAVAFPSDFDVANDGNEARKDEESEEEIDWEDAEEEEKAAHADGEGIATPKAVTVDFDAGADATDTAAATKGKKKSRSFSRFKHDRLNPRLRLMLEDLHRASLLAWASHAHGVSRCASEDVSLGLAHSLIPTAWIFRDDKGAAKGRGAEARPAISADTARTSGPSVTIPTSEDVGHFLRWFLRYVGDNNSDGNIHFTGHLDRRWERRHRRNPRRSARFSAKGRRTSARGGAMVLLCGNVNTDTIKLLGRWHSDAMMRYLHQDAQHNVQQLTLQFLAVPYRPCTSICRYDTYDSVIPRPNPHHGCGRAYGKIQCPGIVLSPDLWQNNTKFIQHKSLVSTREPSQRSQE